MVLFCQEIKGFNVLMYFHHRRASIIHKKSLNTRKITLVCDSFWHEWYSWNNKKNCLTRTKIIQVFLNIKDKRSWQSVDLYFRATFSGRAGSNTVFWGFDSKLTLFFFVICWDSKLLVRPLGGIRPGEVTLHKMDIFCLQSYITGCVPIRFLHYCVLWINTTTRYKYKQLNVRSYH